MANDVKITISGRDNASPVFAGVKQQALGFGLALVGVATAQQALKGAITGTLGAAISFETSFAGIRKTMELSEADFKRLSDANRNLAKTMPITANEFNKIGELAGQLGIKGVKNVLSFEKTIAKLAVTTNLTSEEAALSFAQIANVMKIPQDQIANMGAGVVALGNKFATTERDIVAFTQRIAGAGAIVGLTTGDVLGISTALSSIGVNAEAGGTAVQKVLLEMQKAVSTNSDELKIFAEVADVSVKEFARLFEEDASEAFIGFIEGLTSYGKDGVQVLDALGLADQRLTRAFLGLAAAGDITKRAIDEGNKSVTENTALNEEAERRFKTTASQISILKNNFRDMGIEIGTVALPAIVELSSQGVRFLEDLKVAFGNVKQAVKDLNSSIKEFIGFSPFEFVINMTVNGLGSLDSPRAVLQNIGEAADNVRRSMGNMFSNAAGGISGGIAGIPQSLKNLQDVFTSAGGLGIGGTGLIDPRGPIVKLRPDIFPPEMFRELGRAAGDAAIDIDTAARTFKGAGKAAGGAAEKVAAATASIMQYQNDFLQEQIAAYLKGGEQQLAVVKAAQLGITDRATILAGKLTQVFGIEFPDAMQAAIDFIKGGVTDMAKTIEDARRRVLRDAGGDLWVEQVQGFARDGQQLFATPNGSTFAARPGSARAAGGKMILDPGQIYPHLWVNNITVNALDPQTTAEAVAGAISHLSETGGL